MQTTVYLMRHALTLPEEGLAEYDWVLSETGKKQAEDMVDFLETLNIDSVVSSPFPRAVETLAPFVRKTNVPFKTHEGLRDQKMAPNYLPPAEFQALTAKMWQDPHYAEEGCESSDACTRRAWAALRDITHQNAGQTLLAVTHGQVVGRLLHDLDDNYGLKNWSNMRMPDMFRLIFHDNQVIWDRVFECPRF